MKTFGNTRILLSRLEQSRKKYGKAFLTLYIFKKLNSVALVRTRTIPTERPPPVGEVSANFCG